MTAPSSKLFRNSGEPLAEDVDMLARRCLLKALYGESWLFAEPERPNAIDMLFLPLFEAPGDAGTAMEGEVDVVEDELAKARGFSISTKDFLLLEGDGGAPALFESSMLFRLGLEPVGVARSSTFNLSGNSRIVEGLDRSMSSGRNGQKSVYSQ